MESPFPGMDPYLEEPYHWENVHGQLIAGLPKVIEPQLPPGYTLSLGLKIYSSVPGDRLPLRRPDASIKSSQPARPPARTSGASVLEVEVSIDIDEEVREYYLEIRHKTRVGRVVTVVELLSPTNKLRPSGRDEYLLKRGAILAGFTNLVEIDLLRSGPRLPVRGAPEDYDYSILISRGGSRPSAGLIPFSIREPIPVFSIPLQEDDPEPQVDLNPILREIYRHNRCWDDIDYTRPPDPPLSPDNEAWADALLREKGLR